MLLFFSCILTAYLLFSSPVYQDRGIYESDELDSLIKISLEDHQIPSKQIREYTIGIDTSFTRKIYRVQVPSDFSKTMYHVNLHQRLADRGIDVPARVVFPDKDMDIYLYTHGTVFRTIRLITDRSLDTLYLGD